MPHPMRRPSKPAAPGSAPTLTVSLRSIRNPPLDISLSSQPLTTSVLDLKQAVAENIGNTSTENIRLLYKKKPYSDAKSLKDIVGDEVPPGGEAEFSVMIMGGAASEEKPDTSAATSPDVVMGGTGSKEEQTKDNAPVAQGMSGEGVLDTEEFWNDLLGFLIQRVRNHQVAEQALKSFKSAWKRSYSHEG